MTDRELLELAAKAAEQKWHSYHHMKGLCCRDDSYGGLIEYYWNPLASDGDALRLAVKLGISYEWVNRADYPDPMQWASSPVGLMAGTDDAAKYGWVTTFFGDDPYAATRRAIVRAAAEIGKGMV